ncbi:MAG TPA: bifunctional diaminohydroxyphosphoribosylaminopyrimidine deaminase/5-amino-6-(5-phosphoribosylamino)uracil reductase RibD, partial [Tepidisphaeraceae bacterium]|nr:bifunctional diaminohydroxyphosphoribosylaminopyrimidine deaminase/5-amino-6-(5-phosphoribosylamino)uracil reductase RibD [Tepidisphaeraceae bacterium]
KLARVVVGCVDPNPAVSGNGIAQLRAAGIEVTAPVLEPSAKQLNAPFTKHVTQGLPYVTLKWAQSSDGKVAGLEGQPVWISNSESTRIVHELRARCDGILVGINTVLRDDPLLTARCVENPRSLMRVVLDRSLRIPLQSRLVKTAAEHPLIIYTSENQIASARAGELRALGVTIAEAESDEGGQLSLSHLLVDLGRRPVTHLLVEPGPALAASFLGTGLADRVWIIRSPNAIGGSSAPLAPRVSYPETGSADLNGDRLTEYLNTNSPVCFSREPSVDFALASHG